MIASALLLMLATVVMAALVAARYGPHFPGGRC